MGEGRERRKEKKEKRKDNKITTNLQLPFSFFLNYPTPLFTTYVPFAPF